MEEIGTTKRYIKANFKRDQSSPGAVGSRKNDRTPPFSNTNHENL